VTGASALATRRGPTQTAQLRRSANRHRGNHASDHSGGSVRAPSTVGGIRCAFIVGRGCAALGSRRRLRWPPGRRWRVGNSVHRQQVFGGPGVAHRSYLLQRGRACVGGRVDARQAPRRSCPSWQMLPRSRPRRPGGCPEGIAADEAKHPGLRVGIVGHFDSGPVLTGGPDDLFHLLHPGQ